MVTADPNTLAVGLRPDLATPINPIIGFPPPFDLRPKSLNLQALWVKAAETFGLNEPALNTSTEI